MPLGLILDNNDATDSNIPLGPRQEKSLPCPVCKSGVVRGVHVLPLCFDHLKRSIQLRVKESQSSRSTSTSISPSNEDNLSGNKRERSDSEAFLEVEATQAVYSQGMRAVSSSDADSRRTGRWTDEEVEYVDILMKAFDKGQLPLPHGTKLSNFLCDALLCKASRLTKKMKHAKLSTRTFELQPSTLETCGELEILHSLQEQFIMSMPFEYSRLELEFNLSMHWRSCLSDLCVQVGYVHLHGTSFIESLEEFERLAANAEESMRNVRRRRLAENYLPSSSLPSKTKTTTSKPSLKIELFRSNGGDTRITVDEDFPADISVTFDEPGMGDISHFGCNELDPDNLDNLHDSFTNFMQSEELEESRLATKPSRCFSIKKTPENPFMEIIAEYLEQLDLPFQHADTWVPSFVNNDDCEEVRLIHAGAVTRRDQDGERWAAFENFGEYSKGFSFAPGKGLVGRVYSTGRTMWEHGLNKLDPKFFLRAGGAEEYGVRTAVGIPFPTPGVGLMVVILYSCNHIPEDILLANQFAQELRRYAPAPKWKLVVEMTDTSSSKCSDGSQNSLHRKVSINDFSPPGEDVFWGMSQNPSAMPLGKDEMDSSLVTPRDTNDNDDDSREIVSLIGEQLAVQSESTFEDPSLFQQLMRIRLMLLRPSNRRSAEENDRIDILKNSYKSYSARGLRSGKELVALLAQEWLCLSQSFSGVYNSKESTPFSSDRSDTYRSHEFPPALEPIHGQLPGIPSLDLGKGMMAPPVRLPGSSCSGNNPNDPVVLYDHSIQDLMSSIPLEPFPSQTNFSSPPLSSTMTRTVSCGTSFPALNNQGIHKSSSFLSNSMRL